MRQRPAKTNTDVNALAAVASAKGSRVQEPSYRKVLRESKLSGKNGHRNFLIPRNAQ